MPLNLRVLSATLALCGIITTPLYAATSDANTTGILLSGAQKWMNRDRADLADNLLQKVLLIEPNSPQALLMLGKISLKNGKQDEAQRYLHTLQQTAPGSPQTRELANALHPAGAGMLTSKPATPEPARGEQRVRRAVTPQVVALEETTPQVRPAKHKHKTRRVTEKALTAEKPDEQPVKSDDKASDQATGNAESAALSPDIIARTDALDAIDDGKLEQAETSLRDILTRRPKDPEVLGGLGLIKLKQGKHDEAINWFEQALALAPNQSDIGLSAKWRSLISTAKFWKGLHEADDLLAANRLPEAEQVVRNILVLQPDEPIALALLGNIKSAGGDDTEAERLYRQALAKEGYNVAAISGLLKLLARTGRRDEALALVEQVNRDYADELNKNPVIHAGLLREEADLYLSAQRTSHAIEALEQSIQLDPKNPWARFSLAKLYYSLNLPPLARRVMQDGVALAPQDPTMHYVDALLRLSQNDYNGALASMNQIPDSAMTPPMRETRDSALLQIDLQQAEYQLARGNRREALRIMSIAEDQAKNNPAATEQVAEGWFSLGLKTQGLSAMRKLPQPVPLKTQVYFASLLNRAEQDQELTEYLPSLRIPNGTDETSRKYRATIREIEFGMAGRRYASLIKAGKTDQAQQLADTMLTTNKLSNSDYFKFHRIYFPNAHLPVNAIDQLNQEKQQNPNDADIRYDLAYAYHQDKQDDNARREIQEALTLTPADNLDLRLRVAGLQQDMGDTGAARTTIDDLTARYPNNTDLLLQAGRMAQSEGHYNRAMAYYQKARQPVDTTAAAPAGKTTAPADVTLNLLPGQTDAAATVAPPVLTSTEGSKRIYQAALAADHSTVSTPLAGGSEVERAMNSIRDLREPKIEAGLDIQSKTASSGTSTYNATEIPVLARFPIGYEAHGFVQVDQVNIDAGALPSTFADAALFGKIQAFQYVPPQPLTPKASGTSVAIGYEQGSVKADIGRVGIGFPVSNTVGGIRQGGSFGRMSYSLTLSRRPFTGSQLSYAGVKDPISGTAWGGVTSTGLSLYLSTTLSSDMLGKFNVAGIASYGLLRGKNVLNNDRLYLRGVIDQDIYSSDDMVVNLGVNLNYMSFSKNLSYYTFGQGGYYSPQGSLSIGVPIEVYGRADLLSYQVQASVSYSRTNTDASPFYPTDPVLQARAAFGALPTGYTQPIYSAGTSSGFGYSLRAATEYRATPHVALGGRFSMDRSAYYAPNSVFFYLRYMFKPATGPVKLRPDPVVPYSQY